MALRSFTSRSAGRAAASRAQRGFATAVGNQDFETGEVGGIKYAALDTSGRGGAAITVALKAGPRYEPQAGVAHLLKNTTFKRSTKRSYLRIARETEILGGVLTTGMDREHIYLTAEFTRGDEHFFAEVLGDALLRSPIINHEYLEQGVPSALNELKQAEELPEVRALDAVHNVAFRRGLGNSMFLDKHRHVEMDVVAGYFAERISDPANFAVTASNVSPVLLKELLVQYFDAGGSPDTKKKAAGTGKTSFFGGERRLNHGHGEHGSVIVGFQSAPINDPAWPVVAALLDPTSQVKYGNGNGLLHNAKAKANLRAVNYGYSDAGLFTLQVDGPVESLSEGVKAANQVLKGATSPKDEELKRAIAKAKLAWAESFERRSGLEVMSQHLLANGFKSASSALDAIEKVNASAIKQAIQKATSGPKAVVTSGPVQALPYADEMSI